MSLLDALKKESDQALKEKPETPEEKVEKEPISEKEKVETQDLASKDEKVKEEVLEAETFDEDTVPDVVDEIFNHALKKHASDIHFKPKENKFEVYFRIDGTMVEYKVFDKIYHHPIIARIKIISGLKIDEHRLPQDGKCSFESKDKKEVDLRVSILPTQYGEKVVIRLLEKDPKMVELRDLGMLPNILLKIEEHLKSSYGMILAVGPTGSGKSTSLFSMLSTFNAEDYNISTLEDPIEYKIKDVTQTQINPDIGFDFSDGLRTIVRQDPDIIMVGEIRDQKTASLAIESALTGHLVFSTLHTNTAVGTIQRLLNMDIDRFLISAAVKVIISQRLARKVCSNCREKYPVPEKYHELIKKEVNIDPKNAFFYKANGCKECNNIGYSGRIGLFEVLEMSPAIEELIINNASNAEIEAQAVKEGMILLRKDALYKAVTGDITIEEAIRVMA
ncbi:GspE/PulE family protein [Patescibacteria group bacterium]|nr:GspE/PulE family protein [Patescibacteria group bacterium]MBU1682970.1 GspE/PulE family protein [Patescibacteria group bacterium]